MENINEVMERYITEAKTVADIEPKALEKFKTILTKKGFTKVAKEKGEFGNSYVFSTEDGDSIFEFEVYQEEVDDEPWIGWGFGTVKRSGKRDYQHSGNDPYYTGIEREITRDMSRSY